MIISTVAALKGLGADNHSRTVPGGPPAASQLFVTMIDFEDERSSIRRGKMTRSGSHTTRRWQSQYLPPGLFGAKARTRGAPVSPAAPLSPLHERPVSCVCSPVLCSPSDCSELAAGSGLPVRGRPSAEPPATGWHSSQSSRPEVLNRRVAPSCAGRSEACFSAASLTPAARPAGGPPAARHQRRGELPRVGHAPGRL